MEGNEFTLGYLETMRVVRNYGTNWGIVYSDAEEDDDQSTEKRDQPAPQPRPRGRSNVIGIGDKGQSVQQNAPLGGAHFRGNMLGYFEQLSLSVNWIGGTMETMVRHFNIEQPPHLGYHYLICPRWSEYQNRRGDGAGTSGAQDNEKDD